MEIEKRKIVFCKNSLEFYMKNVLKSRIDLIQRRFSDINKNDPLVDNAFRASFCESDGSRFEIKMSRSVLHIWKNLYGEIFSQKNPQISLFHGKVLQNIHFRKTTELLPKISKSASHVLPRFFL